MPETIDLSQIRALTWDIGGTVFDWHHSIKEEVGALAAARGVELDPALFANPWSIGRYEWAPDSSEFSFLFNQRGHQVMRVIAVDAESGSLRTIVNEECDSFVDYSGKTHMETLIDSNELIWMSERSGWNHLYLYDTSTGKVKNPITQGEWVVRRVDRVERHLQELGGKEVASSLVGERVMDELKALDTLAAARFASVFRDFQTAEDYAVFFASIESGGESQ